MSSEEFQIMRISQRTKEINPRQNTSKVVQSKTSYQKLIPQYNQSQPVSTFVSRRELNQSSPANAGGKNQLPVRANVVTTGTQQTKKIYEYEPRKDKYQYQNQRQVTSIGKAQERNQEREGNKKYETSGSPLNRRTNPMTFSSNEENFNIKKWAYASKQVINKIIIIQRWWRYLLKSSLNYKGRFNQNYAKISAIRSKSSKNQESDYLKDFIKQGENITEKIYPGKNNKLILERRKVEVFKKY